MTEAFLSKEGSIPIKEADFSTVPYFIMLCPVRWGATP